MKRRSPSPSPRPAAGRRRVILHCDADAFFCQVERQLHPDLYAAVPALAVFQHGDVIAADAGAKRLGVRKRDSPAAARRALAAGGGALAHVHVAPGQRVSYRPYDRASRAMHRVLGSREMADTLLRVCGFANRDAPAADAETNTKTKTNASAAESPLRSPARSRRGVVVEKASIDEVFVQLPSGCSLATHAAPCARAIRRAVAEKTGLVLSVGAARNKTLAKFASAAAKPDGVVVVAEQEDAGVGSVEASNTSNKDTSSHVRSRELEFVSESVLLRSTPCSKLRGFGNARVAERMRDALRCETAGDVAALVDRTAGDVERVASRIVAATGVTLTTATRAANAARGVCDEPVRGSADGFRKKSVGVHFSLSTTPRRMPPEAVAAGTVSAAGGRPGWFEPVRVGERARVSDAVGAMAGDLAERVWDECEDEDDEDGDEGDDGEKKRRREKEDVLVGEETTRWPKTLVASVAISRGGAVSRRGAFPPRPAPGLEASHVAEDAIVAAAKALFETATSRSDPSALVTKLSLVATDIRTRGGDRRKNRFDDQTADGSTVASRHRSMVSSFFPSVPTVFEPAVFEPASLAVRRDGGARDVADEGGESRKEGAKKKPRSDGSEPVDAGDVWRAFARGEMRGADFHAMKQQRVEWLRERRRQT